MKIYEIYSVASYAWFSLTWVLRPRCQSPEWILYCTGTVLNTYLMVGKQGGKSVLLFFLLMPCLSFWKAWFSSLSLWDTGYVVNILFPPCMHFLRFFSLGFMVWDVFWWKNSALPQQQLIGMVVVYVAAFVMAALGAVLLCLCFLKFWYRSLCAATRAFNRVICRGVVSVYIWNAIKSQQTNFCLCNIVLSGTGLSYGRKNNCI